MRSIIIYSRLLIVFFSVFHIQASFAAEYKWIYEHSKGTITGSSPTSVCQQVAQFANSQAESSNGRYRYQFKRMIKQAATLYICVMSRTLHPEGTNGGDYNLGSALRIGDSCPVDYLYNPDNGECEPPPPDCSTASPGIFRSSPAPVVNSNGANYVVTRSPGTVCYNRCSYLTDNRASSCFFTPGSQTEGFCNFIGNATGDNCSEPDYPLGVPGDPLNPPNTPDTPPSDPNDPGCPPGYGWSGTTCAKNPDDGGGDTGGGDTGGGDTGGGDTGGGGGGGGDGSGGDGSGGDGSGGDGSGGDTGGGLPGGGGGSGDGSDDEDDYPKSSVSGESCSATITCEGDAIQCAILRSQKMQACADQEARDYSKAAPTINAEIAKGEYQLKEETVDASGFFNMGTRFYSSTCPAPKSLRIESIGRTIQLSYQPLCDFAGALSYIVVAMASLFFMVYVGRSFGGE